ncbi:uncharacterized protein MEPE_01025 [Melanopsichium pennsylvanicum]|uniref:Uncharacterized protein n=1 Tax=Melanopsichium pennsylvanicum TaxID=63383 RepID=A0AAJ5C3C7_9BASI|nr:uncharacterized protein MEPE_01025 [Melanopsichium pennsylvanicum]
MADSNAERFNESGSRLDRVAQSDMARTTATVLQRALRRPTNSRRLMRIRTCEKSKLLASNIIDCTVDDAVRTRNSHPLIESSSPCRRM